MGRSRGDCPGWVGAVGDATAVVFAASALGSLQQTCSGGHFRGECVLRPAAMVVLGPSACFWENTGQTASECMPPEAARGHPFRTLRVKFLVDSVRVG